MKKLAAAKNVDEKVKLFAKITDTFGLETIVSMIPWVGDAGMAIASTVFLIHQWRKIWLPWKSIAKIIWYQALDCAIWAIFWWSTPIWAVIGTLADYLFKSNKKSSELFAEHVRKLEVAAREKWVSEEEIAQLWKKEKEFLTMANSILDAKSKEIKGKGHEKDNK